MNKLLLKFTATFLLSTMAFAQDIKPNDTLIDTTKNIALFPKQIMGERSKASILKTVSLNIQELRNAYNKRLRDKLGLKGKLYVKFQMNEFGSVIFCKIDSSTINDTLLENQVTEVIKRWQFDKLDKPGDVTEVVYPFVFDQDSATIKLPSRSKASIMPVVMANLSELRKTYNKRLLDKPGLEGKITIKFAINEFGSVIFCKVVESTVKDELLENQITEKINRWIFLKIDKPGDVTEVVYPFIFTQGGTQNKFSLMVAALLPVLLICSLLSVIILTQKT